MGAINDIRVYEILKKLSEQNVKPHIIFMVLRLHEDEKLHRGIELVSNGFDATDVYNSIELLVVKGDLTRYGKRTKITDKGRSIMKLIGEIIAIAERIVIE